MEKIRYKCDYCGEMFVTSRGFASHAKRKHYWNDHSKRPQSKKITV